MGWIKVLSEDDLPKDNCEVFFVPKDYKVVVLGFFHKGQFGDCYFGDDKMVVDADQISYYEIIEYPKLPIELI